MSCGHRFTTFERREPEPRFVRKRDGSLQPFDRTKLRAALLRAAHKRPVSPGQVEAIVDEIETAVDAGAYLQFAGTLPATSPQFAEVVGTGSVRVERQDG